MELTNFSEVYKSQPPDSVIIEGKKQSLNLDLGQGDRKVWLVKLPRFLADKWNNIDAIGGKEIAKLKMKQDSSNFKFKLVLNDVPSKDDRGFNIEKQYFDNIPHEYDLKVNNQNVKNQFVFTEQNLDEFADSKKRKLNNGTSEQSKNGSNANKTGTSFTRPTRGTFVKSIPKKTAIVGTICHECTITPSIHDPNYVNVLKERKNKVSKKVDKPIIGVLKENAALAAPSLRDTENDAFFKANKENKNKDGKAVRMDRKDLLDLLFKSFDEYDYWSIKGLKDKVKQPESFLKEVLESIAVLIKRGPYASKYCLKPEYKKFRDAEKAERLKAMGVAVEGEVVPDEDEVDDTEMENVV